MIQDSLTKLRENESLGIIVLSAIVCAVLFLLPYWIPAFFGIISLVSLFSPLPLIYATRRLGLLKGSFTIFLTTVLIALLREPFSGLLFLFEFGILALSLSMVLERGAPIERAILFASLITFFITGSVGFLYAIHNDIGVLEGLRQWIGSTLTQVVTTLEKSNVPADQVQALQAKQEVLVELFLSLSPALVLGFISMVCFLNIIMLNQVLRVLKVPSQFALGDLTRWRSPDKLIWGLIASGFCTVFHIRGLSVAAWNILLLMAMVYFFQGVSIMAYFFRTRNINRFLVAIFYFLLFTQFPLAVLVAITGLFDLWVNFRRL